jgi:ferredoxin
MPTITYQGTEIECEAGQNLRDALQEAGLSPHNGRSALLNCRGHATCGTCAVAVLGDEDAVSERNAKEERRLSIPPHDLEANLRLACQTTVNGDITVRKGDGFWGQRLSPPHD